MGKLISFAVNNAVMTPEEIEKAQFQKIHFRIYSNQLNEHGYLCSLRVLKKYAHTIQGKPILAYYKPYGNHGNGDFGGHEHGNFAQEIAVGFFPNDCTITYEKGEDGTVYLCSDGYIWTEYYQHIVDVFKDFDGVKGVSSEIYMIETEIDEETGIENILQYSFTGLTLLGEYDAMETPIHPAVPGCQGKLVEFSSLKKKYNKAKIDFEKILYCSKNKNKESDSSDSFFNENIKEAEMKKEKVENTAPSEVVENAEKVVTTKVKTEINTVKYDDNYRYVGEENEEHKKVVTEVIQVPEETLDTDKNDKDIVKNATSEEKAETSSENKEEKNISDTESKDEKVENGNVDKFTEETKSDDIDENACKADNTCVENVCKEENADDDSVDETVSIEEFNALKEKCESLENSLSAKTVECEKLQAKCNSLEEYKNNKETEIMHNTINRALNEVSNVLNAVQMDDWKARSKECAIDDTDKFINELKAFAFDVQEKNGTTKPDLLRNSIVTNDVTNLEEMDMWDRIERKYK
ncbi:MAG: hypothetical protein ACLRVD_08000 [Blautia caecimuris]